MFFFLPAGHEQDLYTWPWRTFLILIACVGALIWVRIAEPVAEAAFEARVDQVDEIRRTDPDARISREVYQQAPRALRWGLSGLVSDDPDDPALSVDLELAVLDAIRARARRPYHRLGWVPEEPRPWAVITYAFLHADWGHLLGNLLILYLLGTVVECFWRPSAFLGLYVLSAVGACLAHQIFHHRDSSPLVGASGAASGIMAAFVIDHARTHIHVLYALIIPFFVRFGRARVPALWCIGAWVAVQVWSAWHAGPRDRVAYAAHVGGFLTGVACTLFARRRGWIAKDGGDSLQVLRSELPPAPQGAPPLL